MDVNELPILGLLSLLTNAALVGVALVGCGKKKPPAAGQSKNSMSMTGPPNSVPPAPAAPLDSGTSASTAPIPGSDKKDEVKKEKTTTDEKKDEKEGKPNNQEEAKKSKTEPKKDEDELKSKSKVDEKKEKTKEKTKEEKPKSEKKSNKSTKTKKMDGEKKDGEEEGDGYEACPEMTPEQLAKIADEAGK